MIILQQLINKNCAYVLRLTAWCLMKDKIDVDTQVWEIVTWKFTVDGMGRSKVLLTEKILGW